MRSTRTARRRTTPRGRNRSVKKRRVFIGGNPADVRRSNILNRQINRILDTNPDETIAESVKNIVDYIENTENRRASRDLAKESGIINAEQQNITER